jgi:type II secretory pathway pseudopilin PulG
LEPIMTLMMSRIAQRVGVRSDERGTTMLEVLLAASLFVVLGASMMGVLESTARGAANDERKQQSLNDVRNALDTMSSDLRSATAIDGATAAADMPWSITVQALDRNGANVSLRVERASGALVWTRTAPSPASRTLLTDVSNGSEPMVRYYRSDGVEIVPVVDGAAAVRDCAARLRLTLAVPNNATNIIRSVDIALPNREGLAC